MIMASTMKGLRKNAPENYIVTSCGGGMGVESDL